MSWKQLAAADSKLAEYGKGRLHDQIAYLATIREDGSPRLHPVRPVIGDDRLVVFMGATSPKRHDLLYDGRYVLHGTITNPDGGPWEFYEFYGDGRATLIEDPAIRHLANAATAYPRDDSFILFEFSVSSAFSTVYGAGGQPERHRWQAAQ